MSNTVIYKYPVPEFNCTIYMPTDARIINAEYQADGKLYLWAEIDPDEVGRQHRNIQVIGTGHTVEKVSRSYIKTVYDGPFVWHIYEVL